MFVMVEEGYNLARNVGGVTCTASCRRFLFRYREKPYKTALLLTGWYQSPCFTAKKVRVLVGALQVDPDLGPCAPQAPRST